SVIDDAGVKREDVKRVILCSGKIYVDLVNNDLREKTPGVALVRVEQLYPFPAQELRAVLNGYANAQISWVQEEPENMGAWEFVRWQLTDKLGKRDLTYVGRARMSSPAEG